MVAHVDPPRSFRVCRTEEQFASLPCRNIDILQPSTRNTHGARNQREATWRFCISRDVCSDLQVNRSIDESVTRTTKSFTRNSVNSVAVAAGRLCWRGICPCTTGCIPHRMHVPGLLQPSVNFESSQGQVCEMCLWSQWPTRKYLKTGPYSSAHF